jgi:hypothetical protein
LGFWDVTGGVASPRGPISDRPWAEQGWWDCTAYGAVSTDPSGPLRPAGADLPASAAAAGVHTSTTAVVVPTSGPVPARDTYTPATATRGTCRVAGVPPTAPSPRPAACPPNGDMARGWYPAAPSPGGHDRRLTGFSGTLFCSHRPAGPPLTSGDGGGVRGARRQPDMGSGAPSAGTNVVTGKWIWTHKRQADGTSERYKTRWVLRGFTQRPGVDYDETFSPVVKPATVRTVLSLALARSWPVHQLNVKNAFLHGALTETVYCCQLAGFVDSSRPDMVCRLNRSLYGLKQGPRAWHSRLATLLVTLGSVEAKSDTSLFIHHHGAETAYLLLYVDDIVLTASSQSLLRRLVDALQREFPVKDLGVLHHFLGVTTKPRLSGLLLHQRQYTLDILEQAKMSDCKPCSTLVTRRRSSLRPWVTLSRTPPGIGVLSVPFSTSPSLGRTSTTPCSRSVSICTTPESPTSQLSSASSATPGHHRLRATSSPVYLLRAGRLHRR